jgi:hypothetical protein
VAKKKSPSYRTASKSDVAKRFEKFKRVSGQNPFLIIDGNLFAIMEMMQELAALPDRYEPKKLQNRGPVLARLSREIRMRNPDYSEGRPAWEDESRDMWRQRAARLLRNFKGLFNDELSHRVVEIGKKIEKRSPDWTVRALAATSTIYSPFTGINPDNADLLYLLCGIARNPMRLDVWMGCCKNFHLCIRELHVALYLQDGETGLFSSLPDTAIPVHLPPKSAFVMLFPDRSYDSRLYGKILKKGAMQLKVEKGPHNSRMVEAAAWAKLVEAIRAAGGSHKWLEDPEEIEKNKETERARKQRHPVLHSV